GGRNLHPAALAGEAMVGLALVMAGTVLRRSARGTELVGISVLILLGLVRLGTFAWAWFWPKAAGHGMGYVGLGALMWSAVPIGLAVALIGKRRRSTPK